MIGGLEGRKALTQALPWLTMLVYAELTTVGAFSGGMWGGVGIGFALVLYLGTAWLDRNWPKPSRDLLCLALTSLAVMALLNPFSSHTPASWFLWRNLISIFIPLLLLTCPQLPSRVYHRQFFLCLTLAAFCGAFALGIELLLDAPVLHMAKGDNVGLTSYNRGVSYLVLMSMPIMAGLWTQMLVRPRRAEGQMLLPLRFLSQKFRWRSLKPEFRFSFDKAAMLVLFVTAMLFPAGFTESRASKLAFLLGLLTIVVAQVLPRITFHTLRGLVIVLLAWPYVVQKAFVVFQDRLSHLPESWRARVEIWDYMSYRIAEHPWFGWGLGTSSQLDFKNPHGDMYKMVLQNAPHPHNVVTQLWVELGVPGLVLGVAFAFLTLRQASRLAPPLVPFAFGAWVAALCLSLVAYNFWTDSLFSAFALTSFVFALLDRQLKTSA